MGKPEFSSSEPYLPPKTLAERLKAQANGLAEIEAASFMAERFAPELQTQAANDEEADNSPSEPVAEPVVVVEPAPVPLLAQVGQAVDLLAPAAALANGRTSLGAETVLTNPQDQFFQTCPRLIFQTCQ